MEEAYKGWRAAQKALLLASKKKKKKAIFEPVVMKAAAKRVVASKAYFSNELEDYRQRRLDEGDVPWRILRYQRIIEPSNCPIPLSIASYVTPATFDLHMRMIAEECKPMALSELVRMLDENEEVPDKTAVVTFDGGHMDNFLYAFPSLLKYKIPASIFIAAGYIESNAFFLEDRLALALQVLQKLEASIPVFPFLEERLYRKIEQLEPTRKVTDETANLLILALRQESEINRFKVMAGLGSIVSTVTEPPNYEDFLRWDDIRAMQEQGIRFGLMGYSDTVAFELPYEIFMEGILRSFKKAQEERVELERLFCLPWGAFTAEVLDALHEIKIPYVLGLQQFPPPDKQEQLPRILGRTLICESNSFCKEFFACRMWNFSKVGIKF